jgi:uncharacterized membrane protein
VAEKSYGPLIGAGILIGAALGGLIESVVFRQIAQTHWMLSAKVPERTLSGLKMSVMWDGVLQVFLILTLISGVILLFNTAKKSDAMLSGQVLFGGWFLGWGLYNLIEGGLGHFVFRLHHLLEFGNPATQETGDYGYLVSGALLAALGYWAISSTRSEIEEKEREARRAKQRAKEIKGDKKVYLD